MSNSLPQNPIEGNGFEFYSPAGSTSLKVAGIGFGIMIIGGRVLQDIHPLAPMVSYSVGVISGLAAVLLGVLSLFGVGKLHGTSRPAAGVVGLLLGALLAASPLLIFPAVRAAREAAAFHQVQNQIISETGANPHLDKVYCVGGKLVLNKSGPRWLLGDSDTAGKINQDWSAVAFRVVGPDGKVVVGRIITEPLYVFEESLQELGNVADILAAQVESRGGTIRSRKNSSFQGIPCIELEESGIDSEADDSLKVIIFKHADNLVQLMCSTGGIPDADSYVDEFFSAIELLP